MEVSDPYEVMGLAANAGETEIRQRYLELVREFPPDRAPERFTAIHAAYASLRDPALRLEAQIFSIDPGIDSIESIAADLRARLRDTRLPLEVLLSLAESS
jgi:curved DNA-binding protein CbpA